MKAMKVIARRISDVAQCILVVITFLLSLAAIGKIANMLWPLTTTIFVLFFTLIACNSRRNTLQSLGGIAVYVGGWTVSLAYGPIVGTIVCLLGIIMWFEVAIRVTFYNINLAQTFGL